MPNESILGEVVAASVGGAFSASALYPLEVLKTKMQAKSKEENEDSSSSSSSSSSKEGSDDSMEVIDSPSDKDTSSSSSPSPSASSKPPPSESALSYAKALYQKEGIAPFYAGIETSAFQSATEKALYFFAYTAFKNIYTFFAGHRGMGAAVNLLLGCMAEWAHLPITLPIDCWTTQIQTGDHAKNKGNLAILLTMLKEGDGLSGMYKGIEAYTVLCLKPAIQYTVFEQVKGIMLARKRLSSGRSGNSTSTSALTADTLTAMEAFLLGMVARTIATIATFPYLRAKVVLQSQKKKSKGESGDSSSGSKKKANIPAMIAKMYMSGGLGECFQGLGPELTRGVFSAALMMMMKEKIAFAVKNVLNA